VHEGLRGRHHPAHGDVDAAVAFDEERAAALGRAGRGLALAIELYRTAMAGGPVSPQEQDVLIDDIAAHLYRLVLQRECAGARAGNLDAIVAAYDVPPAALRRL
jgi:hypothetical protein